MTCLTTRWSALALAACLACAHSSASRRSAETAPDALVIGRFEDDYGNQFTITPTLWLQEPGSRYHIVKWRAESGYLIARNDRANPGDGGLWTRIDWLPLPGMPPYAWGFCLSAYRAPTAAAAESTRTARRDTPRTGCNGHPFSRMKPVL